MGLQSISWTKLKIDIKSILNSVLCYEIGHKCGAHGKVRKCIDCPTLFGNLSCSGDCEWRTKRERESNKLQCTQKRKFRTFIRKQLRLY